LLLLSFLILFLRLLLHYFICR